MSLSTFGLNGLNALAKLKGGFYTLPTDWRGPQSASAQSLVLNGVSSWLILRKISRHTMILSFSCGGLTYAFSGMGRFHVDWGCLRDIGVGIIGERQQGLAGSATPQKKIKTERTFVVPYARNKLECVERASSAVATTYTICAK